jgi:hypothetical protein
MSVEAVAFIPEVETKNIKAKTKISSNLFIIPESDKRAQHLKESIENLGYKIEGGIYLYFDGEIKEDGTLYEIFQSYGLALTFYYEGLSTCRAYQQFDSVKKQYLKPELYINENDEFRYYLNDKIILNKSDVSKVEIFYEKILKLFINKAYSPLTVSFEFFNKFLKEAEPKIRLLYLVICMESIFLGKDENEGVGYKLGMRGAYFLSNSDKTIDKNDVFTELKNGYNLRSKIVHGSNYKKESDGIIRRAAERGKSRTELDHVFALEGILKKVYNTILNSDDVYDSVLDGSIGNNIDSIILSTKYKT